MKETDRLTAIGVIVATLLTCCVAYRCGTMQQPLLPAAEEPVVELRIDTCWVHDTVRTAGPVVEREVVREVPASVDTAAILSAYFTERTLTDSFRLRDMATVWITDTLFQNDIVGRSVAYDLAELQPTVSIRHTRPRLALSIGVQLGREQAAPMVGIRYKRAEVLGGYDFRLHAASITLKYDIWQWQ